MAPAPWFLSTRTQDIRRLSYRGILMRLLSVHDPVGGDVRAEPACGQRVFHLEAPDGAPGRLTSGFVSRGSRTDLLPPSARLGDEPVGWGKLTTTVRGNRIARL
ncbi:hypothetical protein GCM10009664_35360 [Kitasatospora gansuensis]